LDNQFFFLLNKICTILYIVEYFFLFILDPSFLECEWDAGSFFCKCVWYIKEDRLDRPCLTSRHPAGD